MNLKHKGIRPTYPLLQLDFKRKLYYEEFPDGKIKIWNKRTLISGCDTVVENPRRLMECYYCPKCDEWFSVDQWVETYEQVVR